MVLFRIVYGAAGGRRQSPDHLQPHDFQKSFEFDGRLFHNHRAMLPESGGQVNSSVRIGRDIDNFNAIVSDTVHDILLGNPWPIHKCPFHVGATPVAILEGN
jgi:hypothetical protein